jgi:hypothetical protein
MNCSALPNKITIFEKGITMKARYLLISLICVFFSGCSTFVNYPNSSPVPESKLGPAFSKYQSPTDETARIVVVRDTGFVGSGVTSQFFINSEFVAKLYLGQSVTLHLKPGEYLLASYEGYSRSPEKHLVEQTLKVTPGETYYYRISAVIPRGWKLEKISLN